MKDPGHDVTAAKGKQYQQQQKRPYLKCFFRGRLVPERSPVHTDQPEGDQDQHDPGDLDDPESNVSRLLRERSYHVLHPEYGTQPRVYYLD